MLEGVDQTVYTYPAHLVPRLVTPGGSVVIPDSTETAITAVLASHFGYLAFLEAICTVAGTTGGTFTLRDKAAGGATLQVFQFPEAPAPLGRKYCWPFPVPWKTALRGGVFTMDASVATLGSWAFNCNGFYSMV